VAPVHPWPGGVVVTMEEGRDGVDAVAQMCNFKSGVLLSIKGWREKGEVVRDSEFRSK